jgi:hypothetical protein
MPEYWIKAGILLICLAASIWAAVAYALAYRHTRRGRYISRAWIYLCNNVAILSIGYELVESDGYHPNFPAFALVLFISLFQVVNMWWELEPQPPFRHSRDILLLRQPPASQDAPDPARGLHVPTAPPAPLAPRTIYLFTGIVAVVSILASLTFVLLR